MSLKTWLAEFYPVPASSDMTDIEAVEHALRKWRGLTKDNLARHRIQLDKNRKSRIIDRVAEEIHLVASNSMFMFDIDSRSCSLCRKYIDCLGCPLSRNLGGWRCDENKESPYEVFALRGDPRPMIKALEATLAQLQSEKKGG